MDSDTYWARNPGSSAEVARLKHVITIKIPDLSVPLFCNKQFQEGGPEARLGAECLDSDISPDIWGR